LLLNVLKMLLLGLLGLLGLCFLALSRLCCCVTLSSLADETVGCLLGHCCCGDCMDLLGLLVGLLLLLLGLLGSRARKGLLGLLRVRSWRTLSWKRIIRRSRNPGEKDITRARIGGERW
jgi:hypothetical protein